MRLESGGEKTVSLDGAMIATGARPAIPPIRGLNVRPYWTSTDALASESIRPRTVVIASSTVAAVLAEACSRLGSRVTVVARGYRGAEPRGRRHRPH